MTSEHHGKNIGGPNQWIIRVKIRLSILVKTNWILAGWCVNRWLSWLTPPPPPPRTICSFSLVVLASQWISGYSGRVELTLGMTSSHYQKPAQAATSLVAVFVAPWLTANWLNKLINYPDELFKEGSTRGIMELIFNLFCCIIPCTLRPWVSVYADQL